VLNSIEHSGMIGVSLDSQLFTREWVRFAIAYTLSKHKDLELFLGDRLLLYNKTVQADGQERRVDFESANAKREKRTCEIRAFINSEIERLPPSDQARIKVTSWSDYADAAMEDILRNLHISYVSVKAFRECVDLDVEIHFMSNPEVTRPDTHKLLSTLYVVAETAMIIRMAELAGKPFFYYPEEEPVTIRSLYNGDFAELGLSVENLTGRSKTRVFARLPLPGQDG
jgi:tRNA-dependent cyclodipeptide synthase